MKTVFITLFAGLMIGVMIVMAVIMGSDVDSADINAIILQHPWKMFSALMSFSIALGIWRLEETHPEWRLFDRFKVTFKKIWR